MAKRPRFFVHESSYIDEGTEIGDGTYVWHFCHVMTDSKIGNGCRIGQNVVIGPRVSIGNNVKIQNNVSVYEGVTLEDDVFCGPSMVFTNVGTPRSAAPRNRSDDFLPTLVKRGATIGADATIICGNSIGEYAFIGAGAVVTKDVPPFGRVFGNPARLRGWNCICGVSLQFNEDAAECRDCHRCYRQIDAHTIQCSTESERDVVS